MLLQKTLSSLYDEATDAYSKHLKYCQYIAELAESVDRETFNQVFQLLENAMFSRSKIFLAGNGGSAGVASHICNDWIVSKRRDMPYPPIVSLTDNMPVMTAIANDYGYQEVFAKQLEALAESGDILVVFSVSGNSKNIVRACEFAKQKGVTTIGYTGFDGGEVAGIVDYSLRVKSSMPEYGPTEDLFQIFGHALIFLLEKNYPSN